MGPYTFTWNFDDGTDESGDQNVVHTFDEAGSYNVSLAITDADDQTASDSVQIRVEESAEIAQGNEAVQEQAAEEARPDQSNRQNENTSKTAESTGSQEAA